MRDEVIRDEDGDYNKRILAFLVLIVLVVIGTGVGTLGLTSDGSAPPPTPEQPVIEATPVAVDGTPSPTPTQTVSDTGSSGAETDEPDDTGKPDSRETPTPTPLPDDSDGAAVDAGPVPSDGGSAGGSSGVDGGRGADSLDLAVDGGSVLIRVADLAPGGGSTGSVVVRNSGTISGTVGVSNASVSDDENGLREPERAAGDTNATGELSAHLRVRLWAEYPDGTREYLFGSANSTVSASSLAGASVRGSETLDAGSQATVAITVSLPESAGNEVQSDRMDFTVPIVLREA
ncbi:hypothetical protein ACOZ4I_10545 [Haloarcula salina]|uniref:hypothetical protein n=1 Tax=Haloarcula salina TaxID=1429914 RepID=UPI003C6FB58C